MASSLFGNAGQKGSSPPSLTESIFGTNAAVSSSTTSIGSGINGLFGRKDTTKDNDDRAKQQSQLPRKRPRVGDSHASHQQGGDHNDRSSRANKEKILQRRKEQAQRDILDQLTISLTDYYIMDDASKSTKTTSPSIRHDELHADVRSLMKHHGLVIVRNALSSRDVDILIHKADATQRSMCALLDANNIQYNDETNNRTEGARFQELAVRCRGRMDVRYDSKTTDPTLQKGNESQGRSTSNGSSGGGGGGGVGVSNTFNMNNKECHQTRRPMPIPLPLIDNMADSILHGAEPPQLVYAGWIFSFPGSADLPWHQDGSPLFGTALHERSLGLLPSYAINVFCGLHDGVDDDENNDDNNDGVEKEDCEDEDDNEDEDSSPEYREHSDLSLKLGPTEFVVGSHHMPPEDAMAKIEEENDDDAKSMQVENGERLVVSASLGKGDILLYDYRICHRGTSNISGTREKEAVQDGQDKGVIRKVLYLMYARPWFREHLNFGDTSLFDLKQSEVGHADERLVLRLSRNEV